MNPTEIGLAVPTFNRPHYLGILLRSVPADIPVVVSVNGARLTPDFISEFPNVRFRPTAKPLEPLQNWNAAISAQTTEWVAIPGDDDLYEEGAFTVVRQHIDQNPTADMIVCGHRIIDQQGHHLSTWNPIPGFRAKPRGFNEFRFGIEARMPAIFFRKSLFEKLNGFDERFLITAGDSDFLQRASLIGNCYFCSDIVAGYRIWQGGTTSQLIGTSGWMEDVELWCRTVERFDKQHGIGVYSKQVRDEIYLRNLIGGLASLAPGATRKSRLRFLRQYQIPKRGQLRSYLRLARLLFR